MTPLNLLPTFRFGAMALKLRETSVRSGGVQTVKGCEYYMDDLSITRRQSIILALGSMVWQAAAKAAEEPSSWAQVDAEAQKLITDRAAPGVSVSVARKGQFIYSKGFGFANLETGAAATPKSIYKIGSITKQFTAASLMLLAEEGKLSVDDPLARYFPDFPRGGEITLRQMLTHTSGLGNYTDTAKPATFIQEARLDYNAEALYRLMLATTPLYPYEPGAVWAYSNTAYVLLGLIVEKVAAEPYGAYFKRRLFDRAGLADTAVDDAADVVRNRAAGYTPHPGEDGRFDNASFISMTVPGGAGSMRSTSEDLCRWHEALFGGMIVRPDSLKQMVTPQRLKDGSLPNEAQPSGGKAEPEPVEYGFGLEAVTIERHRALGHGGEINGFSSVLYTFPAEGISIAILFNYDRWTKLGGPKHLRTTVAKAALADT